MKRWSFIVLTWKILFIYCTFGAPVAQELPYISQFPQFIQYIGNSPLPGGTFQSLLNFDFKPNQIVTSSGIPSDPNSTGFRGAFDMIGQSVVSSGESLASSIGNLLKGFIKQKLQVLMKYINMK